MNIHYSFNILFACLREKGVREEEDYIMVLECRVLDADCEIRATLLPE